MANKAEDLIRRKTKQIADAAGDMRFNRSGTIGTEPIMNPGDPQVRTEVKLGRAGSFQIPTVKDVVGAKAKAEKKLQGVGATIRKNATAFAADIKKNGIHPMDDAAITGTKKLKKKIGA